MAERTVSLDRWKQLEEILVASWDLPAQDREAFWAASTCDPSLLAELRELSAARDAANLWKAPAESDPIARRIGPYVLDRLIGRGGIGAVYLAHRADGEFEQHVAVKIIGLPLEIAPIREQFRRERQILAGLSHPNIARLLDGGTTSDGALYLAMEYIEGVPIDRYAAALDLPNRLRLFREVCSGVEYAHQHLIVHRDLKPSNILIDAGGVPKLLDFGAAKLLAQAESTEQTRAKMLTVAYASPEELRGEPASTSSDVFSLGAVLFELAAGKPVFDGDLIARNDSELKLSAALPADLDRVVRKALAYDRSQRYASVEQLSEDVRRFLNAEPVAAHPPALSYRLRKQAQRHRWALSFAAIFVAAMIGMTAYSLHQARVARVAAGRARAANQFLTSLLLMPFADSASHHDLTVRELLGIAAKRVPPLLESEPGIATDVDLVLGQAFELQHAPGEARAVADRALERARREHDLAREAQVLSLGAFLDYEGNNISQAWPLALKSAEMWKQAPGAFTPEQAVSVLATSGRLLQYMRPTDPVNREYLLAAAKLSRQYASEISPTWRAGSFQALAESYLNAPGNSDQKYRDAYPLIEEALQLTRSDPSLGATLLQALQSWGRINRFLGRHDVDEAAQREAYQTMLKLWGADNARTISQRGVWAYSLTGIGKLDEAYQESQAALAAMRRLFSTPGSFTLWTNTASAANASCLTGRFAECESLAREALETIGPNPEKSDPRVYEARSYLGLALCGEGRYSEALPLLEEAVARFRKSRGGPSQVFEKALETARQKTNQASH